MDYVATSGAMTFQEFAATQDSLAAIARRVGKTRFYLSHVQHGRRAVSKPLAVKVWREFGVKLEPYAQATDEELETFERYA